MNSLEFTTKIELSVIHLPKEFEEYENCVVHVKLEILAVDEVQMAEKIGQITTSD